MKGTNELIGQVKQISDDGLVSRIRMDVDKSTLTSLIITQNIEDLGLTVGDKVRVMIESNSVLIDKNTDNTDTRVT